MTDKDKSARDASSILGRMSKGERDGRLEADRPRPASHRKPAAPAPRGIPLPKDALVGFRKSGGLSFSSREIVVMADGRVTSAGTGPNAAAQARRKLTGTEMAALRRVLDKADLPHAASSRGRQPPDSYAYELSARVGSQICAVEVFDGDIPDALRPLIARLSELLT